MSDVGDMSVQERYASNSICFGCGPSNLNGLRIRSFRSEDGLVMEFDTSPEHQAFPGMVNGGIIKVVDMAVKELILLIQWSN